VQSPTDTLYHDYNVYRFSLCIYNFEKCTTSYSVIFVAVVIGQTTEKAATLGQRVILPCHVDVSHASSGIQVISLSVVVLQN